MPAQKAYRHHIIQRIIDQPWVFFFFTLVLILLYVAAMVRIRHDRKRRQRRARIDRRKVPRPGPDRRWQARPRE